MLQSGPIRFFPAHQSSPSNTASSSPALTPMPTSRSDTPCSNTSFQSTSSSGLPVSGEVVRISTRKECLNPMAFTLLHNNEFDDYKFAKGDVVQEEDLRFLDLVDTSTYFYSRSAASSREASPSTIPVTVSSDPPSLPNVSRPHPIRPLSQLPLPPPPRICHNAYSRKLQL